jgi:hypothetical protein
LQKFARVINSGESCSRREQIFSDGEWNVVFEALDEKARVKRNITKISLLFGVLCNI